MYLFISLSPSLSLSLSVQLFRRVAAALPGMESTQDKSREDSILFLPMGVCVCVRAVEFFFRSSVFIYRKVSPVQK